MTVGNAPTRSAVVNGAAVVVVGAAVSELPPQAGATNKTTRSAPSRLTDSTLRQRLVPVLG